MSKSVVYQKQQPEKAFSYVLITTLLLAKLMKVDIDKALLVKMKEIDKRHES